MATKVRTRRLEKAWSQEELATVAGLNVRTIQRIETGGRASLETLKALAQALDLTVSQLNPVSPGMTATDTSEAFAMSTAETVTQPVPAASLDRKTPQDRKRAFLRHLVVYVVVIGGLAAINLTRHPDATWVQWPALGWGIAVALQGIRAYLR